MRKLILTSILTAALLGTTACSNMSQQTQRTLSGGAIGAACGAALAAVTSGSILGGALIGGVAGAAIGALTTPGQVNIGH